jgi:tetratricopeptide (TPR) repeat protein
MVWILLLHAINASTAASAEPGGQTSLAQKGIVTMTSGQDIRKRFLWGFLPALLLTAAAQANTLTKVQAVESDREARLIFSLTHSPRYTVVPELEHRRIVVHLPKTNAKAEYAIRRFTGPVIRDLEIYEDADPLSPDASEGGLRVEVQLKTAAVVVSHRLLKKSAGLIVNLRLTTPASKTGERLQPRAAAQPTEPKRPAKASHQPSPASGGAPGPSSDPSPAAALAPAPEPAAEASSQEGASAQPSTRQQLFPGPSEPDQTAAPLLPRAPALPATEEMRKLTGGGTAAEALALLDVYFHRPATFTANPALLWSVAAAYVDLGLYEQSDGLYRQIAEHTDNPTLQAAAVLKRGKIALLQGELAKAERLLRECVSAAQPGSLLAEAHEALGDTFMARERFAEAAEMYRSALRHTPEADKPPQTLYKLGRAERQAGRWRNAAEAFRQAIGHLSRAAAEPRRPRAEAFPPSFTEDLFLQLGDSLYKTQRYPEAVVAYQGVLGRAPTAWQAGWALYHLGRSYEALGQYADAARTYQALVQQVDAVWSEVGQQALTTLRWRAR